MNRSRRQLIQASLTLAGLGLLSGCDLAQRLAAQPGRLPLIGYLSLLDGPTEVTDYFLQGLRELGYVEGQTIAIEWRWAKSHEERLPALAAELVALKPDLIVAHAVFASQAAKQATDTIPVVMMGVSEPVASGLVSSLAHPGGNVTGQANLVPRLGGKRVELLRETLPGVTRLAVLWNPNLQTKVIEMKDVETAANQLGIRIVSLEVRQPDELEGALQAASNAGVEALYPMSDAVMNSSGKPQVIAFAALKRLPAICADTRWTDDGCLMAYGSNVLDGWRVGASYVDKILKGAKPADLPVEQTTKFDFVVNLKTARSLGLTIHQQVHTEASAVIQ